MHGTPGQGPLRPAAKARSGRGGPRRAAHSPGGTQRAARVFPCFGETLVCALPGLKDARVRRDALSRGFTGASRAGCPTSVPVPTRNSGVPTRTVARAPSPPPIERFRSYLGPADRPDRMDDRSERRARSWAVRLPRGGSIGEYAVLRKPPARNYSENAQNVPFYYASAPPATCRIGTGDETSFRRATATGVERRAMTQGVTCSWSYVMSTDWPPPCPNGSTGDGWIDSRAKK